MFRKIINLISRPKHVVIIHRHIFKNAGTTFDSILQNNFGDAFCDHRDDAPMRKAGEKYLLHYLKEHPKIKALSSHHIWFNLKSDGEFQFIPIIFLRHPIERIRSVYNFERQQQSDTPGAQMAKKLDFKSYVAWRMKEDTAPVIRNFQTRYLSGIKAGNSLDQNNLGDSLKEVEKHPFIGVVDLFDKSLKRFDCAFKKVGIALDFTYQPQNIAQPLGDADYDSRAQKVIKDLGDVAEEVMAKNNFDLLVYQAAREKIIL